MRFLKRAETDGKVTELLCCYYGTKYEERRSLLHEEVPSFGVRFFGEMSALLKDFEVKQRVRRVHLKGLYGSSTTIIVVELLQVNRPPWPSRPA